MPQYPFLDILTPLREQIVLLGVSGVAGAFFRILMAPEKLWRRRVVQGTVGALSALFLGGVVGHIFESLFSAGAYSYLAAGFIMGSGGEIAVKRVQDRVLGKEPSEEKKP